MAAPFFVLEIQVFSRKAILPKKRVQTMVQEVLQVWSQTNWFGNRLKTTGGWTV